MSYACRCLNLFLFHAIVGVFILSSLALEFFRFILRKGWRLGMVG